MTMRGERMSPAIEPGKTFVALFTPPDAGTFMYHSHMDDGWQNAGGLTGPLIVLPPGRSFDPATDHIVMITEASLAAGGPPLAIDGSLSPAPIAAIVGVPQRLRFADLTLAGQNLVVSLSDGTRALEWTPIAKDGRDLPERLQRSDNGGPRPHDRRNTRLPLHPEASRPLDRQRIRCGRQRRSRRFATNRRLRQIAGRVG